MFRKMTSIITAIVLLLSISSPAIAAQMDNPEDMNAEADALIQQIEELYAMRNSILSCEEIDYDALNSINLQLQNLGVDFLTEAEVAQQFPDAKSSIDSLSGDHISANDNTSSPKVAVPTSSVNTWSTYRISDYWYEGEYYNIQKLTVEPFDADRSILFDQDAATIRLDPDERFQAGATNLIKSVASFGLGALPSTSLYYTIYDIFSSIISGLQRTTYLELGDITYEYENRTTIHFFYVRYEVESDDNQVLTNVESQCKTHYGFIMDVDEYVDVNGNPVNLAEPNLEAGTYTVYHNSPYVSNFSRACYVYNNYDGTPVNDCIISLAISGPGGVGALTIYPPDPRFPVEIE